MSLKLTHLQKPSQPFTRSHTIRAKTHLLPNGGVNNASSFTLTCTTSFDYNIHYWFLFPRRLDGLDGGTSAPRVSIFALRLHDNHDFSSAVLRASGSLIGSKRVLKIWCYGKIRCMIKIMALQNVGVFCIQK